MKMLDLVWQKVKIFIIVNCFEKAGTSKHQQLSPQTDNINPIKGLQNQIDKLGDSYPSGATVKGVISANKNAMSTISLLTYEELIEKRIMNAANGDDADDEKEDVDDVEDVGPSLPKNL